MCFHNRSTDTRQVRSIPLVMIAQGRSIADLKSPMQKLLLCTVYC